VKADIAKDEEEETASECETSEFMFVPPRRDGEFYR
jgi:hypothetical protein